VLGESSLILGSLDVEILVGLEYVAISGVLKFLVRDKEDGQDVVQRHLGAVTAFAVECVITDLQVPWSGKNKRSCLMQRVMWHHEFSQLELIGGITNPISVFLGLLNCFYFQNSRCFVHSFTLPPVTTKQCSTMSFMVIIL
jgi:hypothetical protein